MPNTYTELLRTTVGTATNTVTLSSIPSGYTDLVVVASYQTTANSNLLGRFNSDATSNYSQTYLEGNGTSATSGRGSNTTFLNLGFSFANQQSDSIINVFNYGNATTFKTVLNRQNNAQSYLSATVNLWRKTPEVITSMTIFTNGGNFAVGSTFSLYGIANADLGAAKATGGIITEDANYWYHTFGATGSFIPKQSLTADILVVAVVPAPDATRSQAQGKYRALEITVVDRSVRTSPASPSTRVAM